MKQLIIHCAPDLTQAALMEHMQLVELDSQAPLDKQRAGSIYVGRIVNVLPGMQAAFVDIGLTKNAFLYIDDLLPAHLNKQPKVKPAITDLVAVGQRIMVQVSKEAEGTKGARVTTHFSIPGKWVVYMPDADYVAISRKIEDEPERLRLKKTVEALRHPGEGVIVRTGAVHQSEEALREDLRDLRELWNSISSKADLMDGPCQLYQDLELLPRLVRDIVTEDLTAIWADDRQVIAKLKALLQQSHPAWSGKVVYYEAEIPIFEHFGISEELSRSIRRKIWLPSGGYLVIDQTEALTVIDVNTGKYTGSVDLEQTVSVINLEAAKEIPRLLRLRNIRGIIIVDFIDMFVENNRSKVMEAMSEAVRKDRSRTVIVGWTKLGLLEMTRKRK